METSLYIRITLNKLSRFLTLDLENVSNLNTKRKIKNALDNIKFYVEYITKANAAQENIDFKLIKKYLNKFSIELDELSSEIKKETSNEFGSQIDSILYKRVNGEENNGANLESALDMIDEEIRKQQVVIENPFSNEEIKPEFSRDEIVTKAETSVGKSKISHVKTKFINILKSKY